MDVLKDDLLEALGGAAAPLFLSAVSRQLNGFGPVLTTEEAGGALISALCPDTKFGPLGAKPLIGCELREGGEKVWLTPGECAMHPGLADWTPPSLAQAVMLPLETAYSLAGGCCPTPVFTTVGVATSEGLCSGQLAMTFSHGGRAIVYYGQAPRPDDFAITSHTMSCDWLFRIGDALRRFGNATEAEVRAVERLERAYLAATVH